MRALAAIVSGLLILPCSAQWDTLLGPPSPYLIDIMASSETEVLLLGSDMHKSIDGGSTWNTYPFMDQMGFPILYFSWDDMERVDPNRLVLCGGTSAGQYIIYVSMDNGTTWTNTYAATGTGFVKRLLCLHLFDTTLGFSGGTYGRLVKTTDAGDTWYQVSSGTADNISDIGFWDQDVGLYTASSGVGRTTDGGDTWVFSSLPQGASGLAVFDDGKAIVGGNYTLHTTTDSGASWTSLPAPFPTPNDIVAVNQDTIYIATDDGIFITLDGGAFWEQVVDVGLQQIEDLEFWGDTVVYALADDVVLGSHHPTAQIGPVANFWHAISEQCGQSILSLNGQVFFSGLDISWYVNGALVDTGYSAQVSFTDPITPIDIMMIVNNGVHTDTMTVHDTVFVQQDFIASAGPDQVLCAGDTAQLSASGGTTYSWSPSAWVSDSDIPDPVAWVTPGSYAVTISEGLCTHADTMIIDLPPTPDPGDWSLMDDEPAPGNSGIFAYSSSAVAVHGWNDIMTTLDNGVTYSIEALPPGTGESFVRMLDPFVGYRWQKINTSGVSRTTDGWRTNRMVIPDTGQVMCADFVDGLSGYVAASRLYGPTRLLKTTDGGGSWETKLTSTYSALAIACNGMDTCVVLMDTTAGKVLRVTHDGGVTWMQAYAQLPVGFSDGAILANNGAGVFFLLKIGSNSKLYRSVDGGLNWSMETPVLNWLLGMHFIDPMTGYSWRSNGDLVMTEDGGECWNLVIGGWDGVGTDVDFMATSNHGQSFRSQSLSTPSPGSIHFERLEDPGLPPVLEIGLNEYSLCEGSPVQLWNGSQGYDSYDWFLDGAFLGTGTMPVMPVVAAGSHDLLLIGQVGGDADSVVRTFTVHSVPTEVLSDPVALPVPCMSMDSIGLVTSGALGSNTYLWSISGHVWMDHGDHDPTAYVHKNPLFFFPSDTFLVWVAAMSSNGCVGPSSDTVAVPFWPSMVPPAYQSGDPDVCIEPSESLTSTVTFDWQPGMLGLGFSWNYPSYGTMSTSLNTITVEWNGNPADTTCEYQVWAYDSCGNGPAYSDGFIYTVQAAVTQQPQDQFVAVGSTASFHFNTAQTPSGIEWYHDGVVVPFSSSQTLNISSVQLSDAGEYWATGTSYRCLDYTPFTTQSATLLVSPVGVPDLGGSQTEDLSMIYDPAANMLRIGMDIDQRATLNVTAVNGAQLAQESLDGRSNTVRLDALAAGLYHARLVTDRGTLVLSFALVRP